MMGLLGKIKRRIDGKFFFVGLALVMALYAGVFSIVFLNAPSTLERLESTLAAQTIDIIRDNSHEKPPAKPNKQDGHAENTHHDNNALKDADESHDQAATIKTDHDKHISAQKPQDSAHMEKEHVSKEETAITPMVPETKLEHGLTEQKSGHTLPILRKTDNLSAFEAYRQTPTQSVINAKKHYSIIFTGFGHSQKVATAVLENFPPQATLLLSPYASHINDIRSEALKKGFELWLEIPMETKNFPRVDPGPQAMLSSFSMEYNKDKFYWALSQTEGYAGIAAYIDSKFDTARPILSGLLRDSFIRGLGYFDLNAHANTHLTSMAARHNGPYAKASLHYGTQGAAAHPSEFFDLALAIMENKEHPVIVMPLTKRSIELARLLIDYASKNDMTLAPLSIKMINDKTKYTKQNYAHQSPETDHSKAANGHGKTDTHKNHGGSVHKEAETHGSHDNGHH